MSSDIMFARREARRRKILENSVNRLRSITGENCDIKSNTGSGLVEENECTTHYDNLLMGKLQLPEENNSLSPLQFEGKTSLENSNYRHLQNTTSSEEISVKNGTSVSSKHWFSTDKEGQLIYVALAIVLRILIETNSSYIFLNSLVGAFILTKVGVTSVCGWRIPETSRLTGSFLLISGISSQKARIFVFATSVFSSCVKDFAVLTFVFVFSEVCVCLLVP